MIRLTLTFRSQSAERSFYQNILLIGSGFEKAVDIALEEQALHDEHVKIVKESEGFVVYNLEQDPFTLLNGENFDRSILREGDSLKIGEATVLIEELSEEESEPDIQMSDEEMQELLSDIEEEIDGEIQADNQVQSADESLQGPQDEALEGVLEGEDPVPNQDIVSADSQEFKDADSLADGEEVQVKASEETQKTLEDSDEILEDDSYQKSKDESEAESEPQEHAANASESSEELYEEKAQDLAIEETNEASDEQAIDSDANEAQGIELEPELKNEQDSTEEELSPEQADAMIESLEEGIGEGADNVKGAASIKSKEEQEPGKDEDETDISMAFFSGDDDELEISDDVPAFDDNFDLDTVLGELFPAREEEEEDLDIEMIIEESEKIEEEEERKRAELSALETKIVFDEDETDLLFIREHAQERALDDPEAKEEDEEVAEEEVKEDVELPQELLDAEVEIQEEVIFEEEAEDDEELDEIEMLLGVKDAPKLFAKIAKSTVLVFLCFSFSFYLFQQYILGQNNQKELYAARSLSDLSMALLHKNVYSPKSPHPIDSEAFLENHLQRVVDEAFKDNLPLLSTQFLISLDYSLKVFFDEDKKEFILLALPNKGYLQSFFPKGSIIFDSKSFRLFRSSFLKSWEETFKSVSFLEEVQEYEIEDLIRKSTPLDFSLLDAGDPSQGFSVPGGLDDLAPYGFERVYNLPRYHRFAEKLLVKALKTFQEEASLDDLNDLKNAHASFGDFNELVVYTPGPRETAEKAFWTFERYIPGHTLLYAYFLEQKIDRSELLEPQELAAFFASLDKTPIKDFDLESKLEKEKEIEELELIKEKQIFELPLRELLAQQEKEQQKITQEMQNISSEGMSEKAFAKEYLKLFYAHQELQLEQRKAVEESVRVIFEGQVVNDPEKYGQAFIDVLEELQIMPLLSKDLQEELIEEQLLFQSQERELSIENDFKRIENVEDLKNLDILVNRLSRKIQSSNFENIKSQLSYQNQLRQVVLAKLGQWLFDPEKAPKNRQLLERVLENSDISDEDQRRFYLLEFDSLVERMRSFPDERELARLKNIREQLAEFTQFDQHLSQKEKSEVRKKQLGSLGEIDEQRELIEDLKEKIEKIPVSGILAHEPSIERKSLAKKGQQMLLDASRQEPSAERDKVLEKAIGLLHNNLTDNRALWGDILECRRLIAQTAEKQLLEVLNGDVGFVQGDRPLSNMIKTSLTQYFDEKKKLASLRDKQQFLAHYELFKIKQKNNLQLALRYLSELQDSSRKLKNGIEEYEKRLQIFADDYEKAKLEGFFVTNFQIQSLMAARLNRKIFHAATLRQTVNELNETILNASQEHSKIAQNELAFLEDIQTFSPQELSLRSQAVHEVVYPNLAAEDIEEKVRNIFNILIAPLE